MRFQLKVLIIKEIGTKPRKRATIKFCDEEIAINLNENVSILCKQFQDGSEI